MAGYFVQMNIMNLRQSMNVNEYNDNNIIIINTLFKFGYIF